MEAAGGSNRSIHKKVMLSEEIISTILKNIPASDILKLRCICKSWYALISTTSFTNSFLNPIINNSPSFFIFHRSKFNVRYKEIYLSTFQQGQLQPPTDVLQLTDFSHNFHYILPYSVNGLVCLIGWENFQICNPTTRHIRTFQFKNGRHCERKFALGYDKSKRVYKMVQVFDEKQFKVLTLDSTSWRRIKGPKYPPVGNPVFVDETVFWFAFTNAKKRIILAFNVQDEKFSILNLPGSLKGQSMDPMSLIELEGKLCLVHKKVNGNHIEMEPWAWNLTKTTWIRKYKIVFNFTPYRSESIILTEPRYVIDDGRIILEIPYFGLVTYNKKDQSVETIYNERNGDSVRTAVYTPSLVSLNM